MVADRNGTRCSKCNSVGLVIAGTILRVAQDWSVYAYRTRFGQGMRCCENGHPHHGNNAQRDTNHSARNGWTKRSTV